MERKSFTQWLEEKKISESSDEEKREDLGSAKAIQVVKKSKKQKK